MAFGILQGRHARLREQLSAYIDDELSPPERFEVEHHLETCVDCREELDDLQTIARATGMLPEVPAPHSFILTPGVAGERAAPTRPLEAAAPGQGRRVPWFLLGWAAAGLAALALGAGVAHMLTSLGGSTTESSAPPRANAALPPVSTAPSPTALATVPAVTSATATATASATPGATPAPVVAGVPAGGQTGGGSAAGAGGGSVAGAGGGSAAGAGAAAASAPVGTAGQPGGAAVVTVPSRPGGAPAAAAAAPVATAAAGVVAAPPTRTAPGQVSSGVTAAQPSAPAPAPAAVARPSPPPITGVPPQVIGASNSGVLVPPPAGAAAAGAPVPVRAAPISPTPAGR